MNAPAAPCALFADLRRQPLPALPAGRPFALAYLVGGAEAATRDALTVLADRLRDIPHVTVEATDRATLPFLLDQPWLTRLSLPLAWMDAAVRQSGKALDAVIPWDRRRRPDFHRTRIADALAQGIAHLSVYGLTDFAVWQDLRTWLRGQGLDFYDRYHAARMGQDSLYQTHVASFGDVIALHGWSRLTEAGGAACPVTRTRGPRHKNWTLLDRQVQAEECLLLGLSNWRGVAWARLDAAGIGPDRIDAAVRDGWIVRDGEVVRPADRALWDSAGAVSALLTGSAGRL